MTAEIEEILISGGKPMRAFELLALLDSSCITYATKHHKPLRTVAEAKTVRPPTAYGHTKNLFLRDRKTPVWPYV